MIEQTIKYHLGDKLELSGIKQVGDEEYTVELFRKNEDELWSTQIEDLYNVLAELEEVFDSVYLISMDVFSDWYYATIDIHTGVM